MKNSFNIGFKLSQAALTAALYRKNMTLSELQEKAKISSGTIARALKADSVIRPTTANKIAKALGVDVMSILKTDEPQKEGA